ncbi:MAG: response regulator [Sandaracinaceae bacterium]|nr:response regulator [Sandaracinaceae bacterium]
MRLLVIDDEPRIGLTLRLLLEEHEVTVATSGSEAREELEHGAFDAILCDLMLDDTSGVELTSWIREHHPKLAERVVVMTGGAVTAEDRALFRSLPPERRLDKPFTAAQVRAALAHFG